SKVPFETQPARRNAKVEEDPLRAWTMDFKRDMVGVEVSFNHAEATAWQFTKLSIAGESEYVRSRGQIEVGVVITADAALKRWGRMDGAVLTFDVCRSWLAQMKRVVPTPILLVGLTTDVTNPSPAFRGTRRAPRESGVADSAL
ncbi:MAG: BglII/BstYI family type II restriction endonuclease, partial [Chloroflexota bacterium]